MVWCAGRPPAMDSKTMVDVRWTELEPAALQVLLDGHMAEAARLIAQAIGESAGWHHLGQAGSHGLPARLLDTASALLTLPYDDLPYPAEVRRLVGAHLALGVLLGERPE